MTSCRADRLRGPPCKARSRPKWEPDGARAPHPQWSKHYSDDSTALQIRRSKRGLCMQLVMTITFAIPGVSMTSYKSVHNPIAMYAAAAAALHFHCMMSRNPCYCLSRPACMPVRRIETCYGVQDPDSSKTRRLPLEKVVTEARARRSCITERKKALVTAPIERVQLRARVHHW